MYFLSNRLIGYYLDHVLKLVLLRGMLQGHCLVTL